MIRVLGVLLSILAVAPAPGQVSFGATVSFGDSLTANDFGHWNPDSARVYGPDPMEAVWKRGARWTDDLKNYAIGGATTKHVQAQFLSYLDARQKGRQKEATLISFQIGGNDVLWLALRLALVPPGKSASLDGRVDELRATIESQVRMTMDHHPKARVILWSVPDVTITPFFSEKVGDKQRLHIAAHVRRLNEGLRALEKEPRLLLVDLDRVWTSLATSPLEFGGRKVLGPPAFGERHHLFADPGHPSCVANLVLANHIIDGMNARWKTAVPRYGPAELAEAAGLAGPKRPPAAAGR